MLYPQDLVGKTTPQGWAVGMWNISVLGLFRTLGVKSLSRTRGSAEKSQRKQHVTSLDSFQLPPPRWRGWASHGRS